MLVNYGRLIGTPHDGESLFLYSCDGEELNQIKLPPYMWPTHAVETYRNTFLVSHLNHLNRVCSDEQQEEHNVTEVDVIGQVIRAFNGRHGDNLVAAGVVKFLRITFFPTIYYCQRHLQFRFRFS